jgi:hypothetical protein
MATNFAELKRSRNKDLEKLTQEVTKLNSKEDGKKSYEDTRFWKPVVDKAGNGFAVLRFLPAPEGEDMPWVQLFSHSFQGPTGQWYIENSLTTLNKKDPVSEYNTQLWNSGLDSDKDIARKQKRKLSYIANVYIVKDPANPDNEGKVFLFKFGKKIFDKLNDLMNPEFEDETPVNPFDLWEGANFKLKIRKVEGYQNYDKSEFESPAALSEDDDELENIWKSEHKLKEFLEEKNFKSYDELKTKLNKVLGIGGDNIQEVAKPAGPVVRATESEVTKPVAKKAKTVEDTPPWDDDDENLSYFEKLAED